MLVEYGADGAAGPVAMVVQGALNIDMAALLKQRVGARPFRVFTNTLDARGWLMTFRVSSAEAGAVGRMVQLARTAR